MEGMVRFSKFKLHIHSMIAENKALRETERSAKEELGLSVQRHKEAEAEFSKRLQELQAELASRDELQRKLETKIQNLENDNILLEKRQKELRDTLDNLLKSRDTFIKVYEDSAWSLKNAITVKDKKLNVLSNKVQRHLSLFDSIEKEAEALKGTVDSIQQLVSEKEQVVIRLREKMNRISIFEKELEEKILLMEGKVRNYQHELRRKDTTLLELEEQLQEAKNDIVLHSQVKELQKTLSIKDEIIQSLTSEKQGLHLELLNMELMLQKIQGTVANSWQELDQNVNSSPPAAQVFKMSSGEENERLGRKRRALGEDHPSKTPREASSENPAMDTCDRNVDNSCTSEFTSAQPMHDMDSEGSTTKAGPP